MGECRRQSAVDLPIFLSIRFATPRRRDNYGRPASQNPSRKAKEKNCSYDTTIHHVVFTLALHLGALREYRSAPHAYP